MLKSILNSAYNKDTHAKVSARSRRAWPTNRARNGMWGFSSSSLDSWPLEGRGTNWKESLSVCNSSTVPFPLSKRALYGFLPCQKERLQWRLFCAMTPLEPLNVTGPFLKLASDHEGELVQSFLAVGESIILFLSSNPFLKCHFFFFRAKSPKCP